MRVQKIRLTVVAVPVIAIMVFAAFAFSQSGPFAWPAAASSLLIAGLLVAFLCLMLPPAKRRLHALPEHGGIGLSNSPAVTWVLLGFVAAFVLFVLSFILTWASSGARPVDAIWPTVALILISCAGVPYFIALVRGRYSLGGLLLTPERVIYRSYRHEHSLAWDDVKLVAPGGPPGALRLIGHEAQALSLPCGLLRTPPEPLAALLEYYRTAPLARPELGDGRALQRLLVPQPRN